MNTIQIAEKTYPIERILSGKGEIEIYTISKDGKYYVVKKSTTETSQKNIQREATALKILQSSSQLSEHIVQAMCFENTPSYSYLLLQHIEGNDLYDWLDTHYFQIKDICSIARQALAALSYLAQKSIIHGDIKPENIMANTLVDREGSVSWHITLIDFDCAFRAPGRHIGGTVGYQSPEQITSQEASCLADIFSLAATLIECMSGKKLFSDYREQEKMIENHERILEEPYPSYMRPESVSSVTRTNDNKPTLYETIQTYATQHRTPKKITAMALVFFRSMLSIDPTHRISPQQALECPLLSL